MLQCFRAHFWTTFSSFPMQIPSVYGVHADASQICVSRPDFSSSTLDMNTQLPPWISSRLLKFNKSQKNHLISSPKTHSPPSLPPSSSRFLTMLPKPPIPTSSPSVNPELQNKSQMQPLLLAFISITLQSTLHQGVWSFKHTFQVNYPPTPMPFHFT